MTRTQYFEARRMIRDNGRSALKWMCPEVAAYMALLSDRKFGIDELFERAEALRYFRKSDSTFVFPKQYRMPMHACKHTNLPK